MNASWEEVGESSASLMEKKKKKKLLDFFVMELATGGGGCSTIVLLILFNSSCLFPDHLHLSLQPLSLQEVCFSWLTLFILLPAIARTLLLLQPVYQLVSLNNGHSRERQEGSNPVIS